VVRNLQKNQGDEMKETSENKIFGDFNTQTLKTDNQNVEFLQLGNQLLTKGSYTQRESKGIRWIDQNKQF
jgi:hypothetical protein